MIYHKIFGATVSQISNSTIEIKLRFIPYLLSSYLLKTVLNKRKVVKNRFFGGMAAQWHTPNTYTHVFVLSSRDYVIFVHRYDESKV